MYQTLALCSQLHNSHLFSYLYLPLNMLVVIVQLRLTYQLFHAIQLAISKLVCIHIYNIPHLIHRILSEVNDILTSDILYNLLMTLIM